MKIRSSASRAVSGPQSVLSRLSQRTGLDFTGCHRDRSARVVQKSARASGARDDAHYLGLLERDESRYQELIDRLTVGETYFFREPGHFRLLRDRIVPAVVAAPGRSGVRAWSAGCASGEEPYSIAITLDELGLLEESHILGTDISRPALDRAAAGTYRRWSLRRCDTEATRRWFEPNGERFLIDRRYREAVHWQVRGLMDGPPPHAPFDVVFCRNVLIYLAPERIDAAARTLHDALAPGGWLLMGAADPVLTHPGLRPEVTPGGLVYQRVVPGQIPEGTSDEEGERRTVPPAPVTHSPRSTRRRPSGPRRGARTPEPSTVPDRATGAGLDAGPDTGHDEPRRRVLAAAALLAAGRVEEAATEAGAALYLDPDLVVGQLVVAHCQDVLGNAARAEAGRRHALRLLVAMPADAVVDMADGERAGDLAAVVLAELQRTSGRR